MYTYVSGEEVSRENAARVPFANAYAPIEADVSVAINATKQLTGAPWSMVNSPSRCAMPLPPRRATAPFRRA